MTAPGNYQRPPQPATDGPETEVREAEIALRRQVARVAALKRELQSAEDYLVETVKAFEIARKRRRLMTKGGGA